MTTTELSLGLLILGAGLITYALRLSFIALFERLQVPAWLRRGLRFVPPAVLSAIIIPELLVRDGALDVSVGNARLLAGVLAALVAWRTRNVVLTVAAGMAALWLLQALVR
jgi:branched-subunit amino acid transport protein